MPGERRVEQSIIIQAQQAVASLESIGAAADRALARINLLTTGTEVAMARIAASISGVTLALTGLGTQVGALTATIGNVGMPARAVGAPALVERQRMSFALERERQRAAEELSAAEGARQRQREANASRLAVLEARARGISGALAPGADPTAVRRAGVLEATMERQRQLGFTAEQLARSREAQTVVASLGATSQAAAAGVGLLGNSMLRFAGAMIGVTSVMQLAGWLRNATQSIITFNAEMEQARLGIGGTLTLAGRFVDEFARPLPVVEQLNIGMRIADRTLQELTTDAVRLGIPVEALREGFTIAAGQAMAAGISLKNAVPITEGLVIVSQRLNLPMALLAKTIDNIFTGLRVSQTALGRFLGLSDEMVRSAIKRGEFEQFLAEKLAPVRLQQERESLNTWRGITAAIDGSLKLLSMETGAPIFKEFKEILRDLLAVLEELRTSQRGRETARSVADVVRGGAVAAGWVGQLADLIRQSQVISPGGAIGALLGKPAGLAGPGAVVYSQLFGATRLGGGIEDPQRMQERVNLLSRFVERLRTEPGLAAGLNMQALQQDLIQVANWAIEAREAGMEPFANTIVALRDEIDDLTLSFRKGSESALQFVAAVEQSSTQAELGILRLRAQTAERRARRTGQLGGLQEVQQAAIAAQIEQEIREILTKESKGVTREDLNERVRKLIALTPELPAFSGPEPAPPAGLTELVMETVGSQVDLETVKRASQAIMVRLQYVQAQRLGLEESAAETRTQIAAQSANKVKAIEDELAQRSARLAADARELEEGHSRAVISTGDARIKILQAQAALMEEEHRPLSLRVTFLERIQTIERANLAAATVQAERTAAAADDAFAGAIGTERMADALKNQEAAHTRLRNLQAEQVELTYRQQTAVMRLRDDYIYLGTTFKEVVADVVKGIAFGTGDLGDAFKRGGQALAGRWIEGFIDKKLDEFDPGISKNLLSDVPLIGGKSGALTGTNFVTDFLSQLSVRSGLFGGGAATGGGWAAAFNAQQAGAGGWAAAFRGQQGAGAAGGALVGLGSLGTAGLLTGGALAANIGLRVGGDLQLQRNVARALVGGLGGLGTSVGVGGINALLVNELFGLKGTAARVSTGIFTGGLSEVAQGLSDLLGFKGFFGLGQPRKDVIEQALTKAFRKYGIPIQPELAPFEDTFTRSRLMKRFPEFYPGGVFTRTPELRALEPATTAVARAAFPDSVAARKFREAFLFDMQALGLSAEEAKEQLLGFARAIDLDFNNALRENTRVFLEGRQTLKEYQANVTGLIELFVDLPGVVDRGVLSMIAFNERSGVADQKRIERLTETLQTTVVGGVEAAFAALTETGSPYQAGRALAEKFAQGYQERVTERLLQRPDVGERFSKAAALQEQAAEKAAAGDIAGSIILARQAQVEFRQGLAIFNRVAIPVAGVTRMHGLALGVPGAPGIQQQVFSAQTTSTVQVPGPVGAPSWMIGHGLEIVRAPQQEDRILNELRALRTELQAVRQVVVVHPQVHADISLDGRAVAHSIRLNEKHQRTGMVTPQSVGVRQ